jgi:hypothetical protein
MRIKLIFLLFTFCTTSIFSNKESFICTNSSSFTAYRNLKFGRPTSIDKGSIIEIYSKKFPVNGANDPENLYYLTVKNLHLYMKEKDLELLRYSTSDRNFNQTNFLKFNNLIGNKFDPKSYQTELLEFKQIKNTYLKKLYEKNQIYKDYILEKYINTILDSINIETNIKFEIILANTDDPFYLTFPDGTMILSTGLINLIDTKIELESVITHQVLQTISGFVLQNYKAKKNIDNFLSIAKLISNVAITYVTKTSSNNIVDKFDSGINNILYSTYSDMGFALISGITNSIYKNNGFNLDENQHKTLEGATHNYLKSKSANPHIFLGTINKIKQFYLNNITRFNEENTSLFKYVIEQKNLRSVLQKYDIEYQSKIYELNYQFAINNFKHGNFDDCLKLLNRNFKSKMISNEELYLGALAYKNLKRYKEALNFFDLSLSSDFSHQTKINDYEVFKEKAEIYYLQGELELALKNFNVYISKIKDKTHNLKEYSKVKRLIYRISKELNKT